MGDAKSGGVYVCVPTVSTDRLYKSNGLVDITHWVTMSIGFHAYGHWIDIDDPENSRKIRTCTQVQNVKRTCTQVRDKIATHVQTNT